MKSVEPPKAWAAVAAAVLAAGVAMTFIGAVTTGLSTDEPSHVKRLQNFTHTGLYVKNGELRKSGDAIPPNAYVYGPVAARAMHVANQFAGNEGASEISLEQPAFTVRHLVVAAMSTVGVVAAAVLAWLLLGSWRWGVVAGAVLVAIPMWTGHAMFNPKDIPVATGNTVMSAALVAIALGQDRRWQRLAGYVSLVSGIVLMVGTRPGMWTAVVAGVGALLLASAVSRSLTRNTIVGIAISLVVSYAALWKAYPKVFAHPLTMMSSSASSSAGFTHSIDVSRRYVFERMAIEWPLLLLVFLIVGTGVAVAQGVRSLHIDGPRAAALAVVGAQSLALTLAAIATHAGLYNGLRQLLFTVPAQAVLATVGIAAVSAWTRTRGRVISLLAGIAIVASIALPTIVQARLFPYQYTYANVAAEFVGANSDNDYWETSYRAYVEDVPPTVAALCHHDASDCRDGFGTFKPYWMQRWHHARSDPDSGVYFRMARGATPPAPNCRIVDEVTRWRNFERVTMSRLFGCTPA